jgi:prophage DNA circulation protein
MSNRRPSVFGSLFGSKSFKDVTKAAKQVPPLVKTIQAVEGIFQAGELMYNANETAGNLNDFIPKASKIVDRIEAFVPSMQVMGRSFVDTIKIFNTFNTIATTVGIGANVVLTYQGVQALHLIAAQLKEVSTALAAQTALLAQKDFPQYVYDLIRERLGQTSDDPAHEHWFFVYHPDNDWYVIPFSLLFGVFELLYEGLDLFLQILVN